MEWKWCGPGTFLFSISFSPQLFPFFEFVDSISTPPRLASLASACLLLFSLFVFAAVGFPSLKHRGRKTRVSGEGRVVVGRDGGDKAPDERVVAAAPDDRVIAAAPNEDAALIATAGFDVSDALPMSPLRPSHGGAPGTPQAPPISPFTPQGMFFLDVSWMSLTAPQLDLSVLASVAVAFLFRSTQRFFVWPATGIRLVLDLVAASIATTRITRR